MSSATTPGWTAEPTVTWHEYQLGPAGRLLRVVRNATIRLILGCVLAFGLALLFGLGQSEGVFSDAANAWIDRFTRLAVGLSAGVGVIAGLAACTAEGMLSVATSRALVGAAERGAPKNLVPAPEQDQRAADAPFGPLLVFLGFVLGFDALALIAAIYLLFESGIDRSSALFTLVVVVVAGGSVAAMRCIVTRVRRRHFDRKSIIYQHWGKEVRSAAQDRVRDVMGGRYITTRRRRQAQRRDPRTRPRTHRVRGPVEWVGTGLMWLGVAGLTFAVVATRFVARMRKPGGRLSVGKPDRVYAEPIEQLLSHVTTSIVMVALPAGALVAVATLILACVRRAEWRTLRIAAADAAAAKPAERILAPHAVGTGGIGNLLGVLAACAVVLGWASLIMAGGDRTWLDDYRPRLGGLVAAALAVFLVGIALEFGARSADRVTRNMIATRWSTWLPPQE